MHNVCKVGANCTVVRTGMTDKARANGGRMCFFLEWGGGGTLSVADKVAPTLMACIQLCSIFVQST